MTKDENSGAQSIAAVLERQARLRPNAAFLAQVETGDVRSFAEVRRETVAVARALYAHGVGPGDVVASMVENSIASVLAWFGCAWLGAIEAPIGAGFKGPLMRRLLEIAEPKALILSGNLVANIEPELLNLPALRIVIMCDTSHVPRRMTSLEADVVLMDDLLALPGDDPVRWPTEMSDVACLLFTSGTTGSSSAVLCTYAQEYEGAMATPPPFSESDAFYSTSPPNHVGQKLFLYKALLAGCRFVMRRHFSRGRFWKDIEEYECSRTLLLGAASSFLVASLQSQRNVRTPLKSILMIPIHPEWERFRTVCDITIDSIYNMTEICPVATVQDADLRSHQTIGRIRAGFQWRLVDDNDYEVEPGTPGELILRSDSPWLFSRGYLKDDAKTVSAWRNQWFHTGDVFRADDAGLLYFIDRRKDVIRRRGENIVSGELEYLAMLHPGVDAAAAVGVPSEYTEEDIKLYVVGTAGFGDKAALLAFLNERTPSFMMPQIIEFIDELPMTRTSKVRKDVLRGLGNSGSS